MDAQIDALDLGPDARILDLLGMDIELDAHVTGNGDDVRRAVGGRTDGGGREDGVLEGLAGEHLRGAQILVHHLDDPLAGGVGHLAPFAVRPGNGGAARY